MTKPARLDPWSRLQVLVKEMLAERAELRAQRDALLEAAKKATEEVVGLPRLKGMVAVNEEAILALRSVIRRCEEKR